MKAVNYAGPHKVRVEDISVPSIEHPDDIIVKVTTVSQALYQRALLRWGACTC